MYIEQIIFSKIWLKNVISKHALFSVEIAFDHSIHVSSNWFTRYSTAYWFLCNIIVINICVQCFLVFINNFENLKVIFFNWINLIYLLFQDMFEVNEIFPHFNINIFEKKTLITNIKHLRRLDDRGHFLKTVLISLRRRAVYSNKRIYRSDG